MFGLITRSTALRTRVIGTQQARYMAKAAGPSSKGKPGKAKAETETNTEPAQTKTPAPEPVAEPMANPYAESAAPSSSSSTPPPFSASGLNLPSLDFQPPEPTERTGARSSRDSPSSADERRKAMGRLAFGLFGLGLVANAVYMGREWDEDELKAKKLTLENAPSSRWGRTMKRYSEMFAYFSEPAWPELLPEAYPPPHGKPLTLLVSIDDLLVTSTWDRQHGWRTAKRPGVDYFLAYISQFYEVVVFTTQNNYTAMPILDKLDRYNFFISHRLCREATRSVNGLIVKDLSYLNRDLSKVVMLDTNPDHVTTHPENAIILPKWKGDPADKGLVAMIPFLESIGIYKPADVRPILEAYRGKDIPIEYAKKEAETKAKFVEDWKQKHGGRSASSSGLGSAFGISSRPGGMPLTYLEEKRREAQKNYADEKAYIERNKEYLEKLLKQEQDRMAAEVPSNLWEALDQMQGKPKALPAQDEKSTSLSLDAEAGKPKATA